MSKNQVARREVWVSTLFSLPSGPSGTRLLSLSLCVSGLFAVTGVWAAPKGDTQPKTLELSRKSDSSSAERRFDCSAEADNRELARVVGSAERQGASSRKAGMPREKASSSSKTGTRSIALVAFNLANASSQATIGPEVKLRDALAASAAFYQQVSGGLVQFDPDFHDDGQADAFYLNLPEFQGQACTDEYQNALRQEARNFLQEAHGIPNAELKTLVLVFPAPFACGNSATYPAWCDEFYDGQCQVRLVDNSVGDGSSQGSLVHELGHTLGVSHAKTDWNNNGVIEEPGEDHYGDLSSPMGAGTGNFNAPNYYELGWDLKHSLVVQNGVYTLAPHPKKGQLPAGVFNGLRIAIPGVPEDEYWLSLRKAEGFDEGIYPVFTQGVSIHRYKATPETYFAGNIDPTLLIGRTTYTGDVFKIPQHGIRIRQLGWTPQGYLRVEVTLGPVSDCAVQAPLVSFVPMVGTQAPYWGGSALASGYQLRVTNRDDPKNCGRAQWELKLVSHTLPAGSNPELVSLPGVSLGQIDLLGGQTKIFPFNIFSELLLPPGDRSLALNVVDRDNAVLDHPDAPGTVVYRVPVTPGQAPAAPLSLSGTVKRDPLLGCAPYVQLKWSQNPQNSSQQGLHYQVRRAGSLVAETPSTQATLYPVGLGGQQFRVHAVNSAGQESAASNPVTLAVPAGNAGCVSQTE